MRYNPPPQWPQPPAGWSPPPGWVPDPSWPPPPPGWTLWLDDDPVKKKHTRRNVVLAVLAVLVIIVGVSAAVSGGDKDKVTSGGAVKGTLSTVTVTVTPPTTTPPPTTAAPTTTANPAAGIEASLSAAVASIDAILGQDSTPPQTTAAPTTTVKPKPKATSKPKPAGPRIGEGTYLVGKDIAPGTYVTKGGDICYWERLKNLSGDLDGTLSNDIVVGQGVVTILASDKAFKTSSCADWGLAPKTGPKATTIRQGTFIVGVDIAPGTYKTTGGDGCYWERMKSFTGNIEGTLANDIVQGSGIVTIKPGDLGFKTSGCATWTRE
jgi:hypothetical protein